MEGPDTREVRDILPGAGQSLSCSSKSPGVQLVPGVSKGIKGRLGLIKGVNTK